MLEKEPERGADALVIDLEDSVAGSSRALALETVRSWLDRQPEMPCQVWVRLNEGDLGLREAESLQSWTSILNGFVIPKVRTGEQLDGLPVRSAIALIETSSAIRDLDSLAGILGVRRLMLGEEDLGAEIGASADDTAWDGLRRDVVVASAAAGLPGPGRVG